MDPLTIREDVLTVIQKTLQTALQELYDEAMKKKNTISEVQDGEKKRLSDNIAKRLKLMEKSVIEQIKARAVVVESSQGNSDARTMIHPFGKVDENILTAISSQHCSQSSDSEEAALRQEADKLQAEVKCLSVKAAGCRQTARKQFLNLAQEAVQQRRPISLDYLRAHETNGDPQPDKCADKEIEDRITSCAVKNLSLQERLNSALNRLGRVVEAVEGRHGKSQLLVIEDFFSEHLKEGLH